MKKQLFFLPLVLAASVDAAQVPFDFRLHSGLFLFTNSLSQVSEDKSPDWLQLKGVRDLFDGQQTALRGLTEYNAETGDGNGSTGPVLTMPYWNQLYPGAVVGVTVAIDGGPEFLGVVRGQPFLFLTRGDTGFSLFFGAEEADLGSALTPEPSSAAMLLAAGLLLAAVRRGAWK